MIILCMVLKSLIQLRTNPPLELRMLRELEQRNSHYIRLWVSDEGRNEVEN